MMISYFFLVCIYVYRFLEWYKGKYVQNKDVEKKRKEWKRQYIQIRFCNTFHVLKCVKSSLFGNSFQDQHVFAMLL